MPKPSQQPTSSPSSVKPGPTIDPNAPDMVREPREYNLYLVARARKVRLLAVAILFLGTLLAVVLADERRERVPSELDSPKVAREFSREPPTSARDDEIVFTLDVNAATVHEFALLPGIGAALAERIVEYRDANGPFESVDDLTNVKGLGVKKLERIKPYFVVVPENEPDDDD